MQKAWHCPVEGDRSFAIRNSCASLKARRGWGETCSWELVVVPPKMSVMDTIGQVSLETLLRNQMEFSEGKDLLAKWIAHESAWTTQLYPLWGKPALLLGSTKAWHLGRLFSSWHGVHISPRVPPGTALTHVLVTASWLTGGKETWTHRLRAGQRAWRPCAFFSWAPLIAPNGGTPTRQLLKMSGFLCPSLTSFSCKMIQCSSYSLPGRKKSWDNVVLETSEVLMKTTFFLYFSWCRETPGEVKQAV